MPLNQFGLGMLLTAKDQASGILGKLGVTFGGLEQQVGKSRLNQRLAQIGAGFVAMGAGVALVGGAFKLAEAAGKFEQGMAAIGAVTRATVPQMEALTEAAIRAGIETQFSPDQAVEGLMNLVTAGQTAEQAIRTLRPALDLAAGGQIPLADASAAVVGTLNAFGFAADRATIVTDKLLRATQLTNFQARDFEAGLAKAAATGAVFEQSLDDVLVAMGLLRNRNIDASSSATAFREAVRRVASDQHAMAAVTELGIDVIDRQTNSMRPILDIMLEFQEAVAGVTAEEKNRRIVQAFGARGLLAFNAVSKAAFTTMRDGQQVTLKGRDAIEALRESIGDASGAAAEFRDRLLDTFRGQRTLLTGILQTLAVVAGDPFAKLFKPVVGAVADGFNLLITFARSLTPETRKTIALLTLVTGAAVGLGGAFVFLGGIASLLGTSLVGIFLSLVTAMAPVLLVAGALGLAAVGIKKAWDENFRGIRDTMMGVFEQVGVASTALFQHFTRGFIDVELADKLESAGFEGTKGFVLGVAGLPRQFGLLMEQIRAPLGVLGDAVRNLFRPFLDQMRDLTPVFDGAREAWVRFADGFTVADLRRSLVVGFTEITAALDEFLTDVALIGPGIENALGAITKDVARQAGAVAQADKIMTGFEARERRRVRILGEVRAEPAVEMLGGTIRGLLQRGAPGERETAGSILGDILGGRRGGPAAVLPPSAPMLAPSAGPAPAPAGETVGMVTAPIRLEVDGRVLAEVMARAQIRAARRTEFAFGGLA